MEVQQKNINESGNYKENRNICLWRDPRPENIPKYHILGIALK